MSWYQIVLYNRECDFICGRERATSVLDGVLAVKAPFRDVCFSGVKAL